MKLPIGQLVKSAYKEDLQDKLKRRRLIFFILLLTVPLAIGIMETIGADYTKPETSESLTQPVAMVNTGTSTGSAFLTGSRTLLTARHVVDDLNIGDEVVLVFMALEPPITTTATLVWKNKGSNSESDFAVLKLVNPSVLPDDMPVLSLGDSDGINQDDEIVAVGYPAGIFSFTKGIISSTSIKTAEGDYDLIKIDCQIHHGSSGGPIILTEAEEVVGLAEAGMSEEFQGINFASKINRFIEAAEMDGVDIYE